MMVGVGKARRTSLIAMGLLALSPLTSLGALYQLIAQVGALALLTAAVTLMYRPIHANNAFRLVRGSVPAALIFASVGRTLISVAWLPHCSEYAQTVSLFCCADIGLYTTTYADIRRYAPICADIRPHATLYADNADVRRYAPIYADIRRHTPICDDTCR